MNLIHLLDYGNSIYNLGENINSLKRKNIQCDTEASTAIKMLMMGILSNRPSINRIQEAIFHSGKNKLKGIFKKGEFIPKMHAFRDCINDIKYENVSTIHYEMLETMKKNKLFENHKYRGKGVALIDGVESFETHKNIEGLHLRKHKDERQGYYYKSLGIMYLADDVEVMLDLVPFNKHEVEEDKDHNIKIKSEGEITVLKRITPQLKPYHIEVAVLDCMFANTPCLNEIKNTGIDAIVKLTDERRSIYKDAKGLFKKEQPKKEYEIVEVEEIKKTKYSKESKKKNKIDKDSYSYTREQTSKKLNKQIEVENKQIQHPKKEVQKIRKEKVVKRVKVYSDLFDLDGYEYGKVRVIKVEETMIEKGKEVTKEMYIITTLVDEDLEFIIDLMHRRWSIELKGFRKLKTRYNMKHLFIGTNNAIRLIHYLILIIFNLVELYFNIHTKKNRHINFDNLLEDYMFDMANGSIYKLFIFNTT